MLPRLMAPGFSGNHWGAGHSAKLDPGEACATAKIPSSWGAMTVGGWLTPPGTGRVDFRPWLKY